MRKARIAILLLILGVVPAIAIFGTWLYIRPAPTPPKPPPPPPPKPLPVVLTASDELMIGSLITENEITWAPLKSGPALPAHLVKGDTAASEVIGAVVRRAVRKGAPLTWASIVRPGQYGFLAAVLRPNHRAVTIRVDPATSEAGLIYPGDHVDVILTAEIKDVRTNATNVFTGTILEDIRVVAVNRQVESSVGGQGLQGLVSKATSRNAAKTVTLELPPSEAERLILATSKGKISLAMRSLTDARLLDKRTPTAFENLLALPSEEALPAAALTEPAPAPEEPPAPKRVRIFRGDKHQEVILRK